MKYKTKDEKLETLRKKGVITVTPGKRTKNGKKTDEDCYVVGVNKKLPLSELNTNDIIPDDMDVIETSEKPQLFHRSKHRPVVGGITCINNIQAAGTLGIVVIDNSSNRLVGLTNNHCAGFQYDPSYEAIPYGSTNTTGLDMCQPSPGDAGGSCSKVGEVIRASAFQCFHVDDIPVGENTVDCAIFSLDGVDIAWFDIYNLDQGPYSFAQSKNEYNEDEYVWKSGRTTGVTGDNDDSQILSKEHSFNIGLDNDLAARFIDQILIVRPDQEFSDGGDSGSAILRRSDNKVVGLLFGGSPQPVSGFYPTYANHITDVCDELNIGEWPGLIVVESTEDQITVNGRTFQKIDENVSYDITHTIS